jgi:hypothetical protein
VEDWVMAVSMAGEAETDGDGHVVSIEGAEGDL